MDERTEAAPIASGESVDAQTLAQPTSIEAEDSLVPPSVYLDQFVYIRLARAGLGRGTAADAALHELLLAQAVASEIRFPLSAVHYLETWRHANQTRRLELAGEMIRLSRLHALAPARAVWQGEIGAAVHETFQTAFTAPEPVSVWGHGAAHAFGRDPATFWPTPANAEEMAYREMLLLAAAGIDSEQFATQERERHDMQQHFADAQTALAEQIAVWPANPAQRRQRIRLQTLTDFGADIIPALIGADVHPSRLDTLGAEGLEQFLEAMPTLWALTELRRVRLANPRQGFSPHDVYDLRALSLAIVYCDVVVADRAWCDAVRRTDLPDRFGTTMLNDVADLDHTLRAWRNSREA